MICVGSHFFSKYITNKSLKVTGKASAPLKYKSNIPMVFDSLGHHGKV